MYGYDDYQIKNSNFNAAVYCRLSREDEVGYQSESIKNQKDFLVNYVTEHGWRLYDIYIDDGFTGTNFDRPDFKRLLGDIEQGLVNLVITKDQSRLGRDYITTGHYIEKYFPEKNVRYIAVNDGIDTFINSAGNDISPFRSVINDMYARDISAKVRSAFDTKRKAGKFVGAFAPYGYKKDPMDKNMLIIDEDIAPIIKRIFQLYLEGYGLTKIAHLLNDEGVDTPTKAKEKNGNYKGTAKHSLWGPNTIKSIITNPTYAGCLTQKKYKKVNYKSKLLRTVPKESWITVQDTHEPIVSKQVFEDVNSMISRKQSNNFKCKAEPRLFSGFVFCGDCGAYMTSTSSRGIDYLICSTYKRFTSKYCSRHSFLESQLKAIIIRDIKQYGKYLDRLKLKNSLNKDEENNIDEYLINELNRVKSRLNEISRTIKALYTDRVKGVLDEEEFIALNNDFRKDKEMLNKRLSELENKISDYKELKKENEHLESVIEKVLSIKVLDRYSLEKLISKIEVYENNKVKIFYNFTKPN